MNSFKIMKKEIKKEKFEKHVQLIPEFFNLLTESASILVYTFQRNFRIFSGTFSVSAFSGTSATFSVSGISANFHCQSRRFRFQEPNH